ncbi:MAG: hypothetical protein AB7O62_10710 [Pirellulales bacterium]
MELWWIAGGTLAGLALGAALAWRPVKAARRERQFQRARKLFHQQRERLEAKFLALAAKSGKPRGLRWTDCDFENAVAYARDRRTHDVTAFVGVTIAFEAVAGGPMEGVEAVGNLRAATAVFQFHGERWETEGRAMFNLNPVEAIAFYRDDFEMIAQEAV